MYGTSGVIEMPPPPASPAIQSSRSWARRPPEEPGPWSKLLGYGHFLGYIGSASGMCFNTAVHWTVKSQSFVQKLRASW